MPTQEQSIKQRIIERILELCEPMKGAHGVRVIERKRTLFLVEAVKPAIHLVVGPEIVLEEDNRGYRCEFSVFLKILVEDARNVADVADSIVWKLQTAIEGDAQLNAGDEDTSDALAIKTTYDGEQPFGEDILKPEGGAVLGYVVEYRRLIAQPKSNY